MAHRVTRLPASRRSRHPTGVRPAPGPWSASAAGSVGALQRAVGNAALARLLTGEQQREAAAPRAFAAPIQRDRDDQRRGPDRRHHDARAVQRLPTQQTLKDKMGDPKDDKRIFGRLTPGWAVWSRSERYKRVLASLGEYQRLASKSVPEGSHRRRSDGETLRLWINSVVLQTADYITAHEGEPARTTREPGLRSMRELHDQAEAELAAVDEVRKGSYPGPIIWRKAIEQQAGALSRQTAAPGRQAGGSSPRDTAPDDGQDRAGPSAQTPAALALPTEQDIPEAGPRVLGLKWPTTHGERERCQMVVWAGERYTDNVGRHIPRDRGRRATQANLIGGALRDLARNADGYAASLRGASDKSERGRRRSWMQLLGRQARAQQEALEAIAAGDPDRGRVVWREALEARAAVILNGR